MSNKELKIAIYVDVDNISHRYYSNIIYKMRSKGSIIIQKLFGSDFKNWDRIEEEFPQINIRRIKNSPKKNSTDIGLVVDIMDDLHMKKYIDMFVLVSGDSDYIPLVNKIIESGKEVIGFGNKTTPQRLFKLYKEFEYVEDLKKIDSEKDNKSYTNNVKQNNTKHLKKLEKKKLKKQFFDLIIKTIKESEDNKIRLSSVEKRIKEKYPSFRIKLLGYKRFTHFINSFPELMYKKVGMNNMKKKGFVMLRT